LFNPILSDAGGPSVGGSVKIRRGKKRWSPPRSVSPRDPLSFRIVSPAEVASFPDLFPRISAQRSESVPNRAEKIARNEANVPAFADRRACEAQAGPGLTTEEMNGMVPNGSEKRSRNEATAVRNRSENRPETKPTLAVCADQTSRRARQNSCGIGSPAWPRKTGRSFWV
jgi:hypothetical protein